MLLSKLRSRSARSPMALLRASRQLQRFSSDGAAVEGVPAADDSPADKDKKKAKKPQAPAPPPATTWRTLVVGEIVAFSAHPTADRLNVCQVDVGDKDNLLQIICGAPNVRQGARVPVATVGSKLALRDPVSGDVKLVKIKKSKLRGEVSQGMICSEAELGLADVSDGILILEDDAPVGSLVQDWGSVASRLVQESSGTESSVAPSPASSTKHDEGNQ